MMEQIGMRAPDPRRDRFERDRLRSRLDQQDARGLKRGEAALLWAQSFTHY